MLLYVIFSLTNVNYYIAPCEVLYLQERSLVVLSNYALYEWVHAIPARKSDVVNGFKIERNRRVSLPFRNVILDRE